MSLVVWLPLTGDLHNQGLKGDTIITNTNAVINNDGKIGKCYSFGTTTSRINLSANAMSSFTNDASFCFWIKILSWNTNYATYFQAGMGSTPWAHYIFGFLRNNANSSCCFTISNGTTASNASYLTPNLELNTWYHIGLVYKTGHCLIYINGVLYKDYTTSIVPDFSKITTITLGACNNGTGYQTNCLMNDVRIYDHALSDKEVKEIAKGLVLHYKLDNGGIGNDNILINTHFDNKYSQTTGWNTSKNGTLLANSWGGYNSGVPNQAAVYHAHLKEFNGEYVYEFIKTNDESWLGISQGGLQTKIVAGQTYTFSWEEYHVDGTNRVGTGLYYFAPNATSANFHLGIQQASNVTRIIGQWQKYSYTFTAPSNADYNKNMSWYIYGHYNNNGTFYVRHPKLELGNSATEWAPHPNDGIYNLYSSNVIYDVSGYGNNGTIIGTLSVNNNTSHYSKSILFNGTDACIRVPYKECNPDGIFTLNLWFYKDALGSKNYETLFGGPSGFEMDTRSGASTTLSLYMARTRGGNAFSPFSLNTWYMVTMVRDGTNEMYYINGELKKTIEAKSMPNGIYRIGAWASDTGQNYYGNISDFRIYTTALSEEDILDLYHTPFSIDNKGNSYAREVIEDTNLNITKTGQFHGNEMLDDDTFTTASITKTDKQLKVNTLYEY